MRKTADGRGRSRRVRLFLGGTFLVTWGAWWLLAALTSRGVVTATEPLGVALLVLGGTAPTVVAYLAVWRTPEAEPCAGSPAGCSTCAYHPVCSWLRCSAQQDSGS
jgi:hypothetical protein